MRGTQRMHPALKIVLLVVAALVAIKLLPVTFAIGCGLALALLVLTALGLSAVAVVLVAVVALLAALAPVWLPVVVIVGIIALVKRGNGARA